MLGCNYIVRIWPKSGGGYGARIMDRQAAILRAGVRHQLLSSLLIRRCGCVLDPTGEGGELGVLLHPGELDLTCRTVAVLADDYLSDALIVRGGGVVLVPVQKHHHVRVLLDRSRISQVREQGALVVALLDRARELRYGEHRHVEVAREDLQTAADLRYLLLAVLRAVALAY